MSKKNEWIVIAEAAIESFYLLFFETRQLGWQKHILGNYCDP